MKIVARIISFYFLVLIAIPTLKVVKKQLDTNCNSCCHTEKSAEIPRSCAKEKCILNFNFSTGQFIVQQIHDITFNRITEITEKSRLDYEKVFLSKYQNAIWIPPKARLTLVTTTQQPRDTIKNT